MKKTWHFDWHPDLQKDHVVITVTLRFDDREFQRAAREAAKNLIIIGVDDDGNIVHKSTADRNPQQPSLERSEGAGSEGDRLASYRREG